MSNVLTKGKTSAPITCVLVGAGNRGHNYVSYALSFPDRLKVVGVAEPREFRRNREKTNHKIQSENVFSDWREMAERDKFADFVIITTVDKDHRALKTPNARMTNLTNMAYAMMQSLNEAYVFCKEDSKCKDPAVAFAKKGYHILLEKPMAVTETECRDIVSTCKTNNVTLVVCHVLRYVPWSRKIKEIIESGRIGDVVNISHTEPVGWFHFPHSYVRGNWRNESQSSNSLLAKCCHDVDLINYWFGNKKCIRISSFGHLSHFTKKDKVGFWHFAHSFVRGNWRNEDESSCSLLAKCCHDVDLIKYWLGQRKCQRLSSFGHLTHFCEADKPKGAASRCMDCPAKIENNCAYSAKRFYLDQIKMGNTGWPVSVVTDVPDIESMTAALKTGPYGRCVYESDNDVMSHQVVNFQFEGGATANLTMVAFTKSVCARKVMVYGTKGEISYDDSCDRCVKVFDFLTGQTRQEELHNTAVMQGLGGHGGADFHLMNSFVTALKENKPELIETGADDTLSSHLLVFAAEKARKENCVVNINPDGTF